jgi:GMP synthase-like glutamine amidotransferase/RimJ/RimL family protein N-acetyltransferase
VVRLTGRSAAVVKLGLSIACLQHVPFEGPGAIARWARRRRHRFAVTALYAGEALPQSGAFDWLIVLGGPMGVQDEASHPWLAAEKHLVRDAIRAGRVVVGVCLGAQLVADTLGAPVVRNLHREIGWFPVTLTREAATTGPFAGLPERLTAFHWHVDTFGLPAGARRLAASAGCSEQAFLFDRRVLGLQFHLESTTDTIEGLLDNCGADLAPGRFVQDAATIRELAEAHLAPMHRLLDRTLDALPDAGRFLVTPRLRLRHLRPDDAERLIELDSDALVTRWIDGGRPPDPVRIRSEVLPRLLALSEATEGLGFYIAEDPASGSFLGWFHLRPWQDDPQVLELGWRLRADCWGRGLATEGARALVTAAFAELGAQQVVARTMAGNHASRRVMEKCGLEFAHEYEETRFPGPDRRALFYSLGAAAFEAAVVA